MVTYVVEATAFAPNLRIRGLRIVTFTVSNACLDLGGESLVGYLRLPI